MMWRMGATLAVGLVLVGMGCFGYWLLFMSWSHGYAAASFQFKQAVVLSVGTVCMLVGLILGVMTLVRRQVEGRNA